MPALRLDRTVLRPALVATLLLGLVAPVIGWGLATAVGADAETCALVALASAAPVGTGALGAALASGLPAGAVASTVLVSLLAAPVLLPVVAGVVGSEAGVGPWSLALSLAGLAGLPALLAVALRQVPLLATRESQRGFADIAVAALALLALARMHGVRDAVAADPAGALGLLGLAVLPTLAGLLAVCLVMRRRVNAELLLAGGFRNVALVWAATAQVLPPEGNLLMALTALPIFAMPAVARAASIWQARLRHPPLRTGRPVRVDSGLRAWLLAVLLSTVAAVSSRGEALWHAAEIEEDARALLQGRMPDGVLQTLGAYRYEPGPGVDGYVVCGAVWRAGEVVGFTAFYAATEDSIGFARAAGPIFQSPQAGAAASREIVAEFCRHAGPSDTGTDVSFSVADAEAR
jgi:BASS family bile acid:Na+ symporter